MKERRKLRVYKRTTESGKEVPMILLRGSWLAKYDFHPGDYIAVDCEDGDLRIVKREPEASELETLSERIDKLTPSQKKKVGEALDKMGI